jgi:hypothetical protein
LSLSISSWSRRRPEAAGTLPSLELEPYCRRLLAEDLTLTGNLSL